ncbi:transposase [Streptomyces sp. NBC_00433]
MELAFNVPQPFHEAVRTDLGVSGSVTGNSPRGQTPVVKVRDRGSGRVSMAGMACYKPGERSRLISAIREYRGRRDEPKGCGWRDFRDLIVRARIQLGGPIVLVWDNVRLHLTAGMREFIDANAEWLTVFQLASYAPDLNPQEGVWSLVKRDIGNLAAADLGQITRAVKRRLKQIQYRPHVVDGCLAGAGLAYGTDDLGNHNQRPPRRPPRTSAPLVAISLLRLYRRREPRTHLRRCSQSNA